MMTGAREAQLMEAANLLLDARRTADPMVDLPAALQPTTMDEAYFVQDTMAEAYGAIGGWKIGAPTPDATPMFGPMPKIWIRPSGSLFGHGSRTEFAFNVDNLFDRQYLGGVGAELTSSNPLTTGRYFLGSPRTLFATMKVSF